MNRPTTAAVLRAALSLPFAALAASCITHNVESKPIEIKPIHITMDINLRVQKELEEFFDFEETAAPAVTGKTEGTEQGKE
jgi:hypothetical protein